MKLKDFAFRSVASVFCASAGLFAGAIAFWLVQGWIAGSADWWVVLIGAVFGFVVFGVLGFLLPMRFGTFAEFVDLLNPF